MFTGMNRAQKSLVEKILSFVGIIIAVLLLLGFSDIRKHITYSEEYNAKRTEVQVDNQYRHHTYKVQHAVANDNSNSSNPVIKSIADNRMNYLDLKLPITEFNNVFFNWSNKNQYDNRNQKVTDDVTSNIINNKNIFNNKLGKNIDSTGMNSVLNNEEIAMEHDSGNTITSLINIQYTTWQSNPNDSSSDDNNNGDNKQAGSEWVEVTYDKSSKKVTNIKPLSFDPTYHNHEAGSNINSAVAGSGVEY